MKTNGMCLLLGLALTASAADTGRGVAVEPVAAVAPGGNAGLFVGVNQFTEDKSLRSLDFAVNDAIAQAHLFVVELKLISPANTYLALSGEPTTAAAKTELAALGKSGVRRISAVKSSLLRTVQAITEIPGAPSDMLVLSLSSHGFEERGIAYVMPADGIRGFLEDSAVNLSTVEQRLAQSKAGKRLMLVDACREKPGTEGKGTDAPMTSAFRAALAAAEGQAVLASCDAGQISLENLELGHGVFTHFLLKALRGEATADARGFITLGAVSDYVAQSVHGWVARNRPALDRRAVQQPWFKGPKIAEQIPLAVDPGIRARLGAFKASVAQVADALKPKISRTGLFTIVVYDRLVDALDKVQDDEAGHKLLQWSQDFISGKIPEDVFVGFLDKTVETPEQRIARLEREAAERQARERMARTGAFKAAIAQTVDALKPKISRTGSFNTALYDRLTEALEKVDDNDSGRKLLQRSQDFASGQMDTEVFVAYLDKTLETPDQRQARERSEKMAALLVKAQANDNKENGKMALAALDELLQLDPGHAEAQRLCAKIAAYYGPTKDAPWENLLGMKFVPVKGTDVLFCIWDTRVQDYQAFAGATGRAWEKPRFKQEPTHPAVNVSCEDAKAFCKWLTEKERAEGRLGARQEYRLPAEAEWNVAVGTSKYPWGDQWPPPRGVGNYGVSLFVRNADDYEFTSPVGSFPANQFGLCDMGGNVYQWCENLNQPEKESRVLRGSSWHSGGTEGLLSSSRWHRLPGGRGDEVGFRCVLVVGSPWLR